MKRIYWLLLLLLVPAVASAQGINGRVMDSSGAPVDGANIVLQRRDSTFVDVVLSDSTGLFAFGQRMDTFRLVVNHLACHPRELECSSISVGDIVLEVADNYLNELVVVAERPLVRVDDGRLTYDLQQLVKDKVANNTYEALTKLPGVREEKEALTLVGASSLVVIINGKPSTMTPEQVATLLKATPVERVEKVEVMYSAPPQYHVRGAAINIVLKKDTQYTMLGELGATYRNRFYDEGDGHAFFRLATPKQAFDAMYSIKRAYTVQDVDMLSLHTLRDTLYDIRQRQRILGGAWMHSTRLSYEYNFNDRNNISIAYNGQYETGGEAKIHSEGNFQISDNTKDVLRDNMHNVSLQAQTGIGLSVGADYTFYENRTTQRMTVDYLNGTVLSMLQDAGQDIHSFHLYADQSHSLGKGWKLGYGGKYRGSLSDDYQQYLPGSTLNGNNVSSLLEEHNAEAYMSLERQTPLGLSFSLSATAEFYKVNGHERWSVYPQASLTYMKVPDHIFQGSLNVTKMYPSYWQMQDAVTYLDGYSEVRNTRGLEPSRTYTLNFNYICKQKYVFGLFSNYTHKMFAQTMYQSTDRLALIYQTTNWDYISQSGAMAVLPYKPVSWFDTRAMLVGVYVTQKCDNFFDIGFSDSKFVGIFSLDNSFRIGKDISLELNGFVQTPATQGTFSIETMWSVSAGAKWNFAGGNGTLACYYNDIFNSTIGDMRMNYKGQNLLNRNDFHSRNFTLSLTYRFGGYRKQESKAVDTSRFGH